MPDVEQHVVGAGSASDESKPTVPVVPCDSWGDFMRKVEALDDVKQLTSIWRGQPRDSDDLRASFFRDKTGPIPHDQLRKVDSDVQSLLNMFKASQRYILNPFVGGEDRWSAIARHAGLASPLLDWTFSPYVAAFFAFRNKTDGANRCAIFRLTNKGNK